jgi:gliding motility-associated-like protein
MFTNAAGCDSAAILNLTITQPTQSTTAITNCVSYIWNGTLYITSGSYTKMFTNAAGCDSTAILNLTITQPTQSITSITNCVSYTWNGTTYSNSGSYTKTGYTNTAGCDSTAILNLTITQTTLPLFTQVAPICIGATLSTLPTTSTNGINGSWSPALNNTAITTYTFTPNVGACAIPTTMTIVVNQPNTQPLFTQLQPICAGGNIVLPSSSNNGITGSWSPSINNQATTTYTFTPNAGQCALSATMTVTINNTPSAPTAPTPILYCQYAQSTQLTASSSSTLIWYTSLTGGAGSPTAPSPSTNTLGNQYYYVGQTNGVCEGPRLQILVSVSPKPVLNDASLGICYGATANLNTIYNTNGLSTSWTLNNAPVYNLYNVNTVGNYQLVATNIAGCSDTATVHLTIYPQVVADAGPNGSAVINEPYQLNGSGGMSYLWTPANVLNNATLQDPTAILNSDTRFYLTVMDANGCVDTDSVLIRVFNGDTFIIPNAFTPDGDGLNDIYRPTYLGVKKLEYFRIYNRYGLLMFETNDIGRGWDGRYKGRMQNIGNYIFILKGIDKYGKEKSFKGNVLLLK